MSILILILTGLLEAWLFSYGRSTGRILRYSDLRQPRRSPNARLARQCRVTIYR